MRDGCWCLKSPMKSPRLGLEERKDRLKLASSPEQEVILTAGKVVTKMPPSSSTVLLLPMKNQWSSPWARVHGQLHKKKCKQHWSVTTQHFQAFLCGREATP
ncbi:uncharacterized protein AAGF69_003408 isoform 1-T1 [Amazona ochrocephala]